MRGRLHVIISGLVQGVGFRYATYRKAGMMGLTGWVRNTPEAGWRRCSKGTKACWKKC